MLSPFAHGLGREKGRVGVRLVCAGGTHDQKMDIFCTHGYGLPPGFPDAGSLPLIQQSANAFCGPEKPEAPRFLQGKPFKDPTIGQEEGGYAAAHAEYQDKIQYYAKITEKFYEDIYIKKDFDLLIELFHELFSQDLFARILKHRNDEAEHCKYSITFPGSGHVYYDSPSTMSFDPQLILRKLKKAEFSPESAFGSKAFKELCAYCSFLHKEFARERIAADFESYDDLLRSINISESIEATPPMMYEVLGTALEEIPDRNITAPLLHHGQGPRLGNHANSGRAQGREDCLPR